MGRQFSRTHSRRPDRFVLDDVKCAQEAQIGRYNARFDGRLGHFESGVIP